MGFGDRNCTLICKVILHLLYFSASGYKIEVVFYLLLIRKSPSKFSFQLIILLKHVLKNDAVFFHLMASSFLIIYLAIYFSSLYQELNLCSSVHSRPALLSLLLYYFLYLHFKCCPKSPLSPTLEFCGSYCCSLPVFSITFSSSCYTLWIWDQDYF